MKKTSLKTLKDVRFAQENKPYVNGPGQRSISRCAANTPNEPVTQYIDPK